MIMRALTSLLMMTTGLTGCLDSFEAPERGTPAANEPDPNDPNDLVDEPDGPSDPADDPDDPSNPGGPGDPGHPGDPGDPGQPGETRTWCQPEAYEPPQSIVLPAVPAEALDRSCQLVDQTTYYTWSNDQQVTRYTWVGTDVLWIEYGYDSSWNLLKVTFDANDQRSEVIYGQRKWSGGLVFAPTEDAYRFRYDSAGHLTEFAIERANLAHVYMNQRWVDGRLVERNEARNYYDGSSNDPIELPLHTTWRYEDGRLAGADATFRDSTWSVDWFYDGAGRPVLVERKRDGLMFGRMTWTFDAANHVARRTVLRDPALESPDGYGPGTLDTLGVVINDVWNGDPWANAVPQVSDASCLILPTSDEYGYPGTAVEYELGTARDERPNGIGFAYGANTYGWNYGDLAWYSHVGVHGLDPQSRGWGKLQSDTRFVAGVMVTETVSSPAGPITETRRSRSFDAGNLVVDRMDLTVSPEVYPDSEGHTPARTTVNYGRELQFTWDTKVDAGAPGRLIQRDLVDDEAGLLEWQAWTRDLDGRWLTHSLVGLDLWGSRAAIPLYDSAYDPCAEGCDPTELKLRVFYTRDLDAAGRTTESRVSRPDEQGILTQEQVTSWAYDAGGRLVQQRSNGTYVQTWEYDDAGRVVREAYDYDGVGDDDGWTTTTYDQGGRWVEQASWSGGELQSRNTRTFSCE